MTKTIEVSDQTYELIKDQLGEDTKEINNYEDMIGGKFFFRTVTYHLTGEVKRIVGHFAYLKDAAWIADSGRFHEAIKNGILTEVEPVGDAFINLDTVVDFFPWVHKLPMLPK